MGATAASAEAFDGDVGGGKDDGDVGGGGKRREGARGKSAESGRRD